MDTRRKPGFDHERLDVYQLSLQFTAFAVRLVAAFSGDLRSIRDQLVRASQSIPLNIAEGNGKRSPAERKRFFEIARGSATESAATLDVLVAVGAASQEQIEDGKAMLVRIVAMLTKMTETDSGHVRESGVPYGSGTVEEIDYDYEHDYEHEHEKSGDMNARGGG